eukprot:SAG31_NODE_1565_length_7868_cov_27.758914_9_plen_71_part_00
MQHSGSAAAAAPCIDATQSRAGRPGFPLALHASLGAGLIKCRLDGDGFPEVSQASSSGLTDLRTARGGVW